MTRSLWRDRASPERLGAPLVENVEADLLVVGGGMTGVFAAYHGARLGLDVVLIERDAICAGATGRNAGFLMAAPDAHYATAVAEHGRELARAMWALNRRNLQVARALLVSLGAKDAIEPTGSAVAAVDAAEAKLLEADADLLRADGFPARLVGPEEAIEATGGEGFHGALVVDDDAQVDPVAAVERVARASVGLGARLHTSTPVVALASDASGVVATTANGARARASVAVCGLNAYAPEVLEFARPRVRAIRGQVLATAPQEACRVPRPVYADHGYLYVRNAGGRLVAGGMRHAAIAEEVGTVDTTTPHVQAAIERALARHWPGAAGAPVTHRWSGTMAFSVDGRPWIGEVPGLPGVLTAFGCTGHGWGYWPWAGDILASWAAGERVEIPAWCSTDRPLG